MTQERPTLPDELEPIRLQATAAAIRAYAEITDDRNPIHIDPVFAATTAMGGVIAHGTMSLSLIWQALQRGLGDAVVATTSLDARFLAPLRCDAWVTVGGRQRADEPGTYDVWARSDTGNVIEGIARVGGMSSGPAARASHGDADPTVAG